MHMVKNSIGLDIGGTKISGIVYDGKAIVRELTVPTPKNLTGFKKALTRLLKLLSAGRDITGLGVGMAGVVSPKTGQVLYCPNMKFLIGFQPEKFFKTFHYKKVKVENDANCFALAEAFLGKGKEYKNFIGITLGTGVGGGIVQNKKIYSGAHNSAGEAGHMMADFRYDSEHYFQAAREKKDFKKLGEVVGILFANISNILDVEAIILGGAVSLNHSKMFLPSALAAMQKHVVNKAVMPKILVSNLKNSGSLGAVLLLQD